MKIFITRGEEKSGPFTLDQVREHLDKGHLMSDDLACQEGMDGWIPLSALVDSLMPTNPATPVKSKKRKVLIGIGAFLGVVVVLVIAQIVADMIREAKRMERVVWHLRIKGPQIGISSPSAPPLIGADGTIFVSGDNLYALDGKTGDVIWKFGQGTGGTAPAIGPDGTLFFRGKGNRMDEDLALHAKSITPVKFFAVDGKTGDVKWDVELSTDATSPAVGSDGTVYVGVGGVEVIALNGANGDIKWRFQMGRNQRGGVPFRSDFSGPAIGEDGTIYIGSADKKIYAINADDGTKKWEFATRNSVIATPVIGKDGSVIVGSKDRHIYSLNGETGEQNWAFDTGGYVHWAAAISMDGTVFVGQHNRIFFALDEATGTKKWDKKMEKDRFNSSSTTPSWSPPVIGSDGTVYVGTGPGYFEIFALDGKTGAKKWEFLTGNYQTSFPAIGEDGTLYAADGANIYALRTDNQTSKSSPWPMVGQNPQHTGRAPK
jgi:outer membrane protein assembly factor BamB